MPVLPVRSCENASINEDMFTGVASYDPNNYFDSKCWKRRANFTVKSSDKRFSFSVAMPSDLGDACGLKFGIMRKNASLEQALNVADGGLDPDLAYGVICLRGQQLGPRDQGVWTDTSRRKPIFQFPSNGSQMVMRYSCSPRRSLSLTVNDSAPVELKFGKAIKDGSYIPYFVARDGNVGFRLSVHVGTTGGETKRKRSEDVEWTHVERMWFERRFTDAEIVTASGAIKVHRSIVCSCPQFNAAFAGGYSESCTGQLKVDDVSHSTVEALLQYIYIQQLPDEVDHHELLGLAHRLEQSSLVELCARVIVDNVDASNVCKAACALRTFKDDPMVSDAWKELVRKLASDMSMQEMVLMMVPSSRA